MTSLLAPKAAADEDVGPNNDGYSVGVEEGTEGSDGGAYDVGETDPGGTWHTRRACQEVCVPELLCPDGSYMLYRWFVTDEGEALEGYLFCAGSEGPPTPTPGMILRAFQRIPLPASPLIIEPPDGRTLVNFDTNFYTEKEQLFRSVTLLGQRVELRIDVHSYTWHFDDGKTLRTSDPGAPYPKLEITHNYLQAGAYRPRLDTTYVADYRVNGGSWQTVPDSVTIEGEPEALRAVEARPILTG